MAGASPLLLSSLTPSTGGNQSEYPTLLRNDVGLEAHCSSNFY